VSLCVVPAPFRPRRSVRVRCAMGALMRWQASLAVLGLAAVAWHILFLDVLKLGLSEPVLAVVEVVSCDSDDPML
jgi:hypothetical protein